MQLHSPRNALEFRSALELRNAPLEHRNAPTLMITPEVKKLFRDLQDCHNSTVTRHDHAIDELNRRLDEAVLPAQSN